ncbi:MAG: exodeoxyribonuclease VII large subunit [Chloroflexi bacterium]|nr:exodeoxyribonuclease VII large subunit [Chloroflexota bacterium]
MTDDRAYSVTELAQQIQGVVEGSLLLQGVRVIGEFSNVRPAQSGHWYFAIKDADAQIRCVMWKGTAAVQRMLPKEGDSAVVTGDVTFYVARGELQITVTSLQPVGIGDLYAQLEALRSKLDAEGLFDPARKQLLPPLPARIGVVTSENAAAFQDVLNVLSRRAPLAEVVLAHTLVQGAEAPPQIARAIQALDRSGQVDVILIVRGGGSIEDLWAFNDERVVRAAADCITATVAGVGHETDTTLVDFAADVRAPTPSAAAEIVSQGWAQIPQIIMGIEAELSEWIDGRLSEAGTTFNAASTRLSLAAPARKIAALRQSTDYLLDGLITRVASARQLRRERLNSVIARLEAASPLALLARGYAVVTRSDGAAVRSTQDVGAGDSLSVRVQDGSFPVRVERDDEDNNDGQYRLAGF